MAIDTTLDQVEALYIGYFGRAGEPDGVNYWVGRLNDGYPVADMAASFADQDEAKAEYPFLATPNIVTIRSASSTRSIRTCSPARRMRKV